MLHKNRHMKHLLFIYPSFIFTSLLLVVCLFMIASCSKDMQGSSTTSLSQSLDQPTVTKPSLSNAIDTGGLVAWFDFDNGSLQDKSTYHNRIIFNNATPAPDRNGVANNAYAFNGNGSYMRIKDAPSLNPASAITLFLIVNVNDFYAGPCHGNRIINKNFYDSDPGAYIVGCSDDYYTQSMNCSLDVDKAHETFEASYSAAGVTDTAHYVQTGHWYHLVYTYSNGVAKFYVDGVLTGTDNNRVTLADNGYDVFIGTSNKGNRQFPYWFNGTVDQIGIFNVALNALQVARLSSY